MSLDVSEFATWFRTVHGVAPFPWQERLLREVLEKGWPGTLRLPQQFIDRTTLRASTFFGDGIVAHVGA